MSSTPVDPLAELAQLRQQVLNLNAFAAAAQAQQQQQQPTAPPKVDLPKIRQPSSFSGAMGFVIDDWLGEMVQQFSYYGSKFPNDASRIRYAVAYLSGPAMHWWEHEPDRDSVTSWTEFTKRLHARFRPVQAAMLARQKLGKLSQRTGQTVNQYTNSFQITMTPIVDMSDADQVHHYVNGLAGPIAAKVWEKHPMTLKTAIDYAVSVEAMINYGRAASYSGHSFAGRGGNVSSSSSSSGSVPMDTSLNNINATESESLTTEAESAASRSSVDPFAAMMSKMESAFESRLNAMFGSSARGGTGAPQRRQAGTFVSGLKPGEVAKLMAEGRCFRCKKTGHMKNDPDCPMKPKNA